MTKVAVIGRRRLKKGIGERLRHAGMHIEQISSRESLKSTVLPSLSRPDVVVLDLSSLNHTPGSRSPFEVLSRAQDMMRDGVPLLVLTSSNTAELASLRPLFQSGLTDFVRLPVAGDVADVDAVEEVFERTQLLLERVRQRMENIGPLHLVPQLHNPQSGRLDARPIAGFFGLSLAALARVLGTTRAALHKTPDAPSLQPKLRFWHAVAGALLDLLGSEETARIWLQTPNPELEGQTPLTLMKAGDADIVAELLRDVLTGQPA